MDPKRPPRKAALGMGLWEALACWRWEGGAKHFIGLGKSMNSVAEETRRTRFIC